MLKSKWALRALFLLMLLAGGMSLKTGVELSLWQSEQVNAYNAALAAYEGEDFAQAAALCDRSLAAYERDSRAPWLSRFFLPHPTVELAARAQFIKGLALLQQDQHEGAMRAWQESLRLNPGNGTRDQYESERRRLHELALLVKYDLEILMQMRSDLASQQGANRQQGDGQPRRAPGQDPGSMPGPGNRDDL